MKENTTGKIWIIDALKGIFILFVLMIHCNGLLRIGMENMFFYVYLINLAVSFFMIMSGYTFALSFGKQASIREYYRWKNIGVRLLRFLLPIIVSILLFLLVTFGVFHKFSDGIIKMVLANGMGPGSYYFVLVIELTLIFPLIYRLIEKLPIVGMLILVALAVGFEALVSATGLSNLVYTRIIIRFLPFIGAGVEMYFCIRGGRRVHPIILALSAVLGIAWLALVCYGGFQPWLFKYHITDNSLPVLLWCAPLIYLCLMYLRNFTPKIGFLRGGLRALGNASFHILAIQVVWFDVILIFSKVRALNPVPWTLISLIVCILLGYLYYRIDSKVQKKITAAIRKT